MPHPGHARFFGDGVNCGGNGITTPGPRSSYPWGVGCCSVVCVIMALVLPFVLHSWHGVNSRVAVVSRGKPPRSRYRSCPSKFPDPCPPCPPKGPPEAPRSSLSKRPTGHSLAQCPAWPHLLHASSTLPRHSLDQCPAWPHLWHALSATSAPFTVGRPCISVVCVIIALVSPFCLHFAQGVNSLTAVVSCGKPRPRYRSSRSSLWSYNSCLPGAYPGTSLRSKGAGPGPRLSYELGNPARRCVE